MLTPCRNLPSLSSYIHASVYRYTMTSRNLTVKEEVYRKLVEAKKGNESFSKVIERLLQGKSDLMSFAGILSHDREFADAVSKDTAEVRKLTVIRNDSD